MFLILFAKNKILAKITYYLSLLMEPILLFDLKWIQKCYLTLLMESQLLYDSLSGISTAILNFIDDNMKF